MATLRVSVEGNLGQLSADSFAIALQSSLQVLHDLDRRLSEQRNGSLEWVISRIGAGSAWVELRTRVKSGETDHSRRVHRQFTHGLNQIQKNQGTPAYFSLDDVRAVQEIVRQIGRGGVNSVVYEPPVEEREDKITQELAAERVELTQEAEPELMRLTGTLYRAIGSIEGLIELVSVRRKARRFNITHARTLKSIKCNLPESLEASVFEAIQQRRRVVATGLVSYNFRDEPISLFLDKPLRFLGRPAELPSVADLSGSDPDITNPLDTEDFIRALRDG